MNGVIITTTSLIDGYKVAQYLGIVNANFVAGTDFMTDFFASVSDIFGGVSGSYKSEMDRLYERAKWAITEEAKRKGANAILGFRIDFDEISGKGKSMFMISVSGTAVKLTDNQEDAKQAKVGYRYEIYQRLYNLHKFKECGIITEEQYDTEKNSILYAYEEDIKSELEEVKSHNDLHLYEMRVKEEAKERRVAQMRELEELKARQREEEELKKQKEAEEFEKRKACLSAIKDAQDIFMANSTKIYNEVRARLNLNVINPVNTLNNLTLVEIKSAHYDISNFSITGKMAYVVGRFVKENKIAEACKYYIDSIQEDDIVAAKSYVQSIYEMITFSQQSAFEKICLKFIELKHFGKTEEAITEFMKYAVCDRGIAEQVIDIL